MPRRARRDFETSFFHVIVQGINREFIFKKKEYIEKYYQLLMTKTDSFNVKVLAYCLMNNHAHLLVYVEDIENLENCMQSVNTAYAIFYNKRENRVGYVFRDRYLSEPVYNERQLFNCISYIHFNPVNAGIVKSLDRYPYSSYRDFLNHKGIVTKEKLVLLFGSSKDYLDLFHFIHYGIEECMEVDKQIDLIKYQNISVKDKTQVKEAVADLKNQGLSNRKIAAILNISRNRISKI